MKKKPLYSPQQIVLGAFLGGPLAPVYCLRKNFEALGDQKKSNYTLLIGVLYVTVLIFTSALVPAQTRVIGIAAVLLQLFTAEKIAKTYQMSKQAILESPQYKLHSHARVVAVILVCVVLGITLVGAGTILVDYLLSMAAHSRA